MSVGGSKFMKQWKVKITSHAKQRNRERVGHCSDEELEGRLRNSRRVFGRLLLHLKARCSQSVAKNPSAVYWKHPTVDSIYVTVPGDELGTFVMVTVLNLYTKKESHVDRLDHHGCRDELGGEGSDVHDGRPGGGVPPH